MTDHLNYFCPYENQRPDSENALTRAFLALLRLSPTVHEAFLEEIRAQQRSLGMNENVLPLLAEIWSDDASIRTQKAFVGQETGRLLSVLIAPEVCDPGFQIDWSERQAVYDGILNYPPGWLIILESKLYQPTEPSEFYQLHPGREDKSEDIELVPPPVVVAWPRVMEKLQVLRIRNLLSPTENRLLDDFFSYVENEPNLARLGGFRTLSMCQENMDRLRKRCLSILEKLPGGYELLGNHLELPKELRNKLPCRQIHLNPRQDPRHGMCIVLGLYPGDLSSQASAFYRSLDANALASLQGDPEKPEGWDVYPNLHFSFKGSHLQYPGRPAGLKAINYLQYWQRAENMKLICRSSAPESGPERTAAFMEVFDLCRQFTSEGDEEVYRRTFPEKNYQFVDLCPGVCVGYYWPIKLAAALDDTGKFVGEVEARIREAFRTWQQDF